MHTRYLLIVQFKKTYQNPKLGEKTWKKKKLELGPAEKKSLGSGVVKESPYELIMPKVSSPPYVLVKRRGVGTRKEHDAAQTKTEKKSGKKTSCDVLCRAQTKDDG